MTQEQQELLLKDLCARYPYVVKVECNNNLYRFVGIQSFNIVTLVNDDENNAFTTAGIKYIKPYLFPLSSMTEEQEKEVYEICKSYLIGYEPKLIDFYNKNHLDYRGLIPMGLGIDATGLNIY